ncbi:lysylphosphatidylglycerol synthase domain-containing protein [Micromonospora cathayae]|uniref:Lysylphosphatidylglycerol synthase domain-containing protein n=1 Tax=Micromonospora cathayae TaxID=3028804 RepID=A0ABY7ZN78_9ACTN|nr:lysylphosphatidylglycerol synthase domain-containing protein [Micromonospora sp. HUAS 3]WDZ83528.1 lysylphosphatidylglycerol synthase domain-containing protein [Micromonospora sp. HUAS 3]
MSLDTVDGPAVAERTAPPWRRRLWRVLAVVFGVAVVVAVGRALAGQDWSVVAVLLARRDGTEIGLLLAGALLAATVGPLIGMLSWRVILLELGPPVRLTRVMRIFLVGFLAKYVPGKVPGIVAAVKVATANGVTLPRMLVAGTLSTLLVHLTGLSVGLLTGGQVLGGQAGWLVLAALPVLVAVAWPRTLDRLVALVLRLARRPEPARSVSGRAVRVAVGWQTLSWLVSGVHLWLLAVAMGADPAASLPLCVGAFGLATVVGVLAVVVPDGLGVREAALTGALALVLPVPSAVAVAVASRLVTTVGEVVLGGAALAVVEIVHRRSSAADAALEREMRGHVQVDRA